MLNNIKALTMPTYIPLIAEFEFYIKSDQCLIHGKILLSTFIPA